MRTARLWYIFLFLLFLVVQVVVVCFGGGGGVRSGTVDVVAVILAYVEYTPHGRHFR